MGDLVTVRDGKIYIPIAARTYEQDEALFLATFFEVASKKAPYYREWLVELKKAFDEVEEIKNGKI